MKSKTDNSTKLPFFGLGKIAPYLGTYKGLFTVLILGSLVPGVLGTILPLFQKYAIDIFIGGRTTDGLVVFSLAYLIILAASFVTAFFGDYSCCKLEMFLLRDLRRDAFNHLQTLSVSYFGMHSVGKLHARVMSDTANIAGIISWDINQGVWNLVYIVGALTVMFVLDPLLALCVFAIVPVVVLISVFFNRKLTSLNRRVREVNSEITGGFNEGITGAATSKTLAVESRLDADFYARTDDMKGKSQRLGHHRALLISLISFASSVALALVLWRGGLITQSGAMLIGTLSVFMTYAQGLMEPILWFVNTVADLVTVRVNAERFSALMAATGDVTDSDEVTEKYGTSFAPKTENWEKIAGDVEFRDVSFKYPDGDSFVLEHFNLKVPRGTNVAIVGETGAGKSTLVNLVCRFYEPTAGAVLIDGVDIRERSVGWLHSQIGYVLQSPHLFSGTVRQNLTYGRQDATDGMLDVAIEAVNAKDIIDRLDNGYDSAVGEGGNNLSVGEKQLISFARAILVDPAIFVLDEATSSVDTLTEKRIQQAIEKLMDGRTSFVIAHRLSTVRAADIILVVRDGKIIEQGSHKELIDSRGEYFKLYMRQFAEESMRDLSSN